MGGDRGGAAVLRRLLVVLVAGGTAACAARLSNVHAADAWTATGDRFVLEYRQMAKANAVGACELVILKDRQTSACFVAYRCGVHIALTTAPREVCAPKG